MCSIVRDGVGADALMRLRMALLEARVARADPRRLKSGGDSSCPLLVMYDIISVPPAMTRSSMPDLICAAAMLTAVRPLPQKRSSVTPLALTSNPASSAAMRPISPPCLPFCAHVPQTMSSISAVLMSLRV